MLKQSVSAGGFCPRATRSPSDRPEENGRHAGRRRQPRISPAGWPCRAVRPGGVRPHPGGGGAHQKRSQVWWWWASAAPTGCGRSSKKAAVLTNFSTEVKDTPDIYFAGNGLSTDALLELMLFIGDRDFSVDVISKSGTTTEPAVAPDLQGDAGASTAGGREADLRHTDRWALKGLPADQESTRPSWYLTPWAAATPCSPR